MRLGQPIVIETDELLYYTLITRLFYPGNPIAERFANSPFVGLLPSSQIEGVRGEELYGLADLSCLKLLPNKAKKDLEFQELMREFDTIPPIFSKGRQVTEEEIDLIYKTSEYTDAIGTLRGFNYPVPIDFAQLVKKPYGLFGRTGIGKSILNKILCLFILRNKVSQLLLFDMQGEYGMVSRADKTKGLAWYFPDKVKIYRLGKLDTKEKVADGAEPFFVYKENIALGDIIASAQTLSEPSINVLYYIENLVRSKPEEYSNLLDVINSIKAEDHKEINKFSLNALRNRIIRFKSYKFLKKRGDTKRDDSLEDIFKKLVEGKSIIVDFGKYGINRHLYYFIANMITRRLYQIYSEREEESELPPLVVVLEEAHKFLQPRVIRYTIFDRIAREMRKFQLTLAFVDQRPSQIDDEVFSQIANRFILNLTDTKDIERTVKNLPNPKKWRAMISGLIKRQCLVYGDAIAVPTMIDILDYKNDVLFKDLLGQKRSLSETIKTIEKADVTKIFPED